MKKKPRGDMSRRGFLQALTATPLLGTLSTMSPIHNPATISDPDEETWDGCSYSISTSASHSMEDDPDFEEDD